MSVNRMDTAAAAGPLRPGAVRCTVCGARVDGAFLCGRCLDEIESALGDLPADLADLQAVATLQARGPLGLGDPNRQWEGAASDGALGDAPWMFAPAAADLLWAVGNTLSTWVRHLCESRRFEPPRASRGAYSAHRALRVERNRMQVRTWRVFHPSPDQPVSPLVAWLLTNIAAIAQDEAAAQIHDEITSIGHAVSRNVLGPPPADEFYGLCDDPDVRVDQDGGTLTPRVGRCGTQLFGPRDARQVDCPTCGASYTRAERHASMIRELADTLGTVRQVASTLTTLGRPVTVDQIHRWVKRGLVVERGTSPRLVRVGDIVKQREAVRTRAAARRKVTAA